MPIFCSDPEVRSFVLAQVWNISIYSQPEFVLTALELFEEAGKRFGGERCWDLKLVLH